MGSVRGSELVAMFGAPPDSTKRVAAIDLERMLEGFRQGMGDLLPKPFLVDRWP